MDTTIYSALYLSAVKRGSIKPVRDGTLSFKMGFTPIGSKQTYWSDDVEIQILPKASAVTSGSN